MARTNTARVIPTERLVAGGTVRTIGPERELRRTVMACMLFENNFYESGESAAKRIERLVPLVDPVTVAEIAVRARSEQHLRHVPLKLVREMARHKSHRPYVADALSQVIQRADEPAEFLALYWKDGKVPIAASVKKGLAHAFTKFNAYQLAKYNQDASIKLRDVLFLCHAKPKDAEQAATWKALVEGTLESPDTWEVELSAAKGVGKRESWTRLLNGRKLGAFALIRNLRNMEQAGVEPDLIKRALREMNTERILPFRFVAAALHARRFEGELNDAMLRCAQQLPKLPGETVLVVDVSGSMYAGMMSSKSDMSRAHAACALGALARESCEGVDVYATAGNDSRQVHATELVPARRGLPLVDAIFGLCRPLGGGGIFLKQCIDWIWDDRKQRMADRVIVITDGQDTDRFHKGTSNVRQIAHKQYIINVASDKNGIGYGAWTNIDGWSEHVLDYIRELEASE